MLLPAFGMPSPDPSRNRHVIYDYL
ncbi:MAG: hypothetical protein F6K38_27840 [Moorea sp. SIO3B2]|nr:hypothetical protein [Moorena sp. SIO3B2]